MRTYNVRSHRVLADGSIELEGRWSWVPAIAIGMLVVLPIARRIPMALLALLFFGIYLLAFPPRRRVIFDRSARALRIDHAGLFAERGKVSIPFEDVEAIEFEDVGRRRAVATARTRMGDVYLCTLLDRRDAARMADGVKALLGG